MAKTQQRFAAGQLRTLYQLGAIGDLSDRQLLERFTSGEAELAELAFSALVERHGPMVLRVCSALLRNPHDAQDAVQATFLVLLRKARDLWIHESLGPWLHRVARRLAVQIQASARRRRAFERMAARSITALCPEAFAGDGPGTILHDEIDRLPERYRVPVILCHLEGQSQELAAKFLRLPVGTVKSRLHKARRLLRERLSRRNAEFSATLLSAGAYSGSIDSLRPLLIYQSLVRAASRSGINRPGTSGLISARAVHLFEETIKTMFLARMRIGVGVALLAGCLVAGAAGVFAQQGSGRDGLQPGSKGGGTSASGRNRPAPAVSGATPDYIRQSRKMIIERLEFELGAAKARLDRTTRKVASLDDPEAVRARKTFQTLTDLISRIDSVLAEAVDQFPTAFDFSERESDHSNRVDPPRLESAFTGLPLQNNLPDRKQALQTSPDAEKSENPFAVSPFYEHSLAKAVEKLERSRKMHEKGYLSDTQYKRELAEYEALKTRIGADIARAQDRVEWAKKMYEKGYVSKGEYDAEILKHYDALKALIESPAVSDAMLKDYERLKKMLNQPAAQGDDVDDDTAAQVRRSKPSRPSAEPGKDDPSAKSATDTPKPF